MTARKTLLKAGKLDQALNLTDKLATAVPPEDATDRARVLRAVIYAGEVKSTMELADAYGKGVEKAKNPRFQSEYRRLQQANRESAGNAALKSGRNGAPDCSRRDHRQGADPGGKLPHNRRSARSKRPDARRRRRLDRA